MAYESIESAVEVMRLGAEDYLVKPFEAAELLLVIRRAVEFRAQALGVRGCLRGRLTRHLKFVG